MTSDEIAKLILRVSLKDREAFDRLYQLTCNKLFGVCLRILRDRAEAEEILQEIYVKVWTKADRFSVSDLSAMSWLMAVARNHAIDRVRSRRVAAIDLDDAADMAADEPDPETQAMAAAQRQEIDRCLDELDSDRASAVRGAYLNGDSYAELAQRHKVPLNTMRTWLRRSLMKLKDCLER